MSPVLPPIRRIVTADDAEGRSHVVQDGPSPAVREVPERPGYRVTNVWRTLDSPAPIGAADSIAEHVGISPPPRGTVVRIIDFPPEAADPQERRRALHATFSSLYGDAAHDKAHQAHPGMHRTRSVDYAIVIEGEIVAILDKEETVMRAGDILIQRGTNHAWANRSAAPCRIAFILIDGA